MIKTLIVFNAGSSSLKFSLFKISDLSIILHGQVYDVFGNAILEIKSADDSKHHLKKNIAKGYKSAITEVFNWIEVLENIEIIVASHRVVHGGNFFFEPTFLDPEVTQKLKTLCPLAPLHQPHNVEVIEIFAALYPAIPQIACFDTAFHKSMIFEEKSLPLPRSYCQSDIVRYGFHGISYNYIAQILKKLAEKKSLKKVIVAHLGSGASICAMKNLKSVATTMGFTPLEGLMMGTRSGTIDPGVILHLMKEKNMTVEEVSHLLYQDSGLKGFSGISHDLRILEKSKSIEAKEAIDLFCYLAVKHIAGLIPAIRGLDILVFTAGIGENSWRIRENIGKRLEYCGLVLDKASNRNNEIKISAKNSKIEVYVIPTNEEKMIAELSLKKLMRVK